MSMINLNPRNLLKMNSSSIFKRFYRPAVSDPSQQEKIMAVRAELAALGIATGRSKGRRNELSAGTAGVSPREAIERLREADLAAMEAKNRQIREEVPAEEAKLIGPNSLLMNIQVKLLKEQSNGVRGVLNIPNPELLNSRPSILVFAPSGEASTKALEAGANLVGGDDLVAGLIEGSLPAFNRCLATTSMLPMVTKVARILGPKGLMPNVKTGTLVDAKDIGRAVKMCLQSVPFKIEKCAGLMNLSIGSLRGSNEKLLENFEAVLEHLEKLNDKKPAATAPMKNKYVSRVYLSTRYQPGILIKI